MEIHVYQTPYLSSKTYLIEERGKGFLIDPCEVQELSQYIYSQNLHIDTAFLTHEHADHITGVAWVQHQFGSTVWCSAACNAGIQDPKKNRSYYYNLFQTLMGDLSEGETVSVKAFSCVADSVFIGSYAFYWQDHDILLKETPGHSDGSTCILLDNQYLFSGDTLLNSDKSVVSLDGSKNKLEKITIPWLQSLDRDIKVFPGHYETFLLGKRLERGNF